MDTCGSRIQTYQSFSSWPENRIHLNTDFVKKLAKKIMFKSLKMPSPLPPSESTKLGKLRVCHKPGIAKKLSRSVSQHMGKKFATFYHAPFCEVDYKFDFILFSFLFHCVSWCDWFYIIVNSLYWFICHFHTLLFPSYLET